MPIPPTLTPEFLKEVLNLAAGQRRKIEHDLEKEFPEHWYPRSESAEEFYERLHQFLQTDINYDIYNDIAFIHSNKRRSLEIPNAIIKYFDSKYGPISFEDIYSKDRYIPGTGLRDILPGSTPEEVIIFAWLLIYEGFISPDEIEKLLDEDPELKELSGDFFVETDQQKVVRNWRKAIVDISNCVIGEKASLPNMDIVRDLKGMIDGLDDIVEEYKSDFWRMIDELIDMYSEYLSGHENMIRIREDLRDKERRGPVPDNHFSVLANIRRNFDSFVGKHKSFNDKCSQLASAPFEQQQNLMDDLNAANTERQEALGELEESLSQLLRSEPEPPDGPDGKQKQVPKGEGDPPIGSTDRSGTPDAGEGTLPSGEDTPGGSCADTNDEEGGLSPGAEAEEVGAVDPPIVVPPVTGPDQQGKVLRTSGGTSATEALPDRSERENEPDPAVLSASAASALLDDLLRDGEFARAYWVANVCDLLNADILGVLSEGARVEPGSACSGVLAQFINALAARTERTDDENMLLNAAILQPLLFLRTYPPALYQVVSTIGKSPLSDLIETVRRTYLPQGITLGRLAVQADNESARIEQKIEELAAEARTFLDRVPSIRFDDARAEPMLRYLYGPDSGWRLLHELISENRAGRLKDIRELSSTLDPAVVDNLQNELPEFNFNREINRRSRDKLQKHLHASLALAADWASMVESSAERAPEGRERQIEELKKAVISGLKEALQTLEGGMEKSAATAAAHRRAQDLFAALNGEHIRTAGIEDACIDLPGIRLDEDLAPGHKADGGDLAEAMKAARTGNIDPSAVLDECLDRDEFVRAARLIERHRMGAAAESDLKRRVASRRGELRRRFQELQANVEEAFLLGQLWDSGEQAVTRTDLLSLIDGGLSKLDGGETPLAADVGSAATLVGHIEDRMARVAQNRLTYLEVEKSSLLERFPDTRQGREDRDYFDEAIEECLSREDHVAAFDLFDRARRAFDRSEPIARTASTALDEHFMGFLEFDRQYGPIDERACIDSIGQGMNVLGMDFSQLERDQREEVVSALEKWRKPAASGDVEEICRFIGFPVVKGKARFVNTNSDQLTLARLPLNPGGTASPLPVFGSEAANALHVVVGRQGGHPSEVVDFLKQTRVNGSGGVVAMLPGSKDTHFRMEWLRECVRQQMTVLPVDTNLLMYVSGRRHRLKLLLDAALPFTWAQPYITKGETVAPEMFVGRSEESRDLVDRNGSCIVFGGRQLGKSALLTHVRREFDERGDRVGLCIAYLDVNDLGEPQTPDEMAESFWQRVSEQLVVAGALGKPDPKYVRSRKFRWAESVPTAIQKALRSNGEKRILLLLDETDDLLDLDSTLDFGLIRRLRELMAHTERRFKVVLAGLQSVQRYSHWKNHPFAQLGREIVVDPLAPKAAEELVVRPFRALGFAFDKPELVLRILSTANYHPGLIQIFCHGLLDRLYTGSSRWQSPERSVTEDDIATIEQDPSFQEDVRNRFDWTLDLDERYKVITYGLVLSARPTVARSVLEFKYLGRSWWPAIFDDMDAQAMRAVLDEMVGLGVLAAEHGEGLTRRYRLRSPNLLRLLGSREEIDAELERIISAEGLSRHSPREFRALIEPDQFGPLTRDQENHVCDADDLFSLALVIGSPAMGSRQVATQVREAMKSAPIHNESGWVEMPVRETGGARTGSDLLKTFGEQLSPRQRSHRFAVIDLEEYFLDSSLVEFLGEMVRDMRKICRGASRGKIVLVLDPLRSWEWMCASSRSELLGTAGVSETILRRWSRGAVSNALDRLEMRTGSKAAGAAIHEFTGGIHDQVCEVLTEARREKGGAPDFGEDAGRRRKEERLSRDRTAQLSELGLVLDGGSPGEAAREIFRWAEGRNGEWFLTEDVLNAAKDECPEGSSAQIFLGERRTELTAWLHALDLAWPSGQDDAEYRLCPWVVQLTGN